MHSFIHSLVLSKVESGDTFYRRACCWLGIEHWWCLETDRDIEWL